MPQNRIFIPLPLPANGVHPELSKVDMDTSVAYDAENWIYRDGRLRVRDGFTAIGSALTGRPIGFANWFDYADPTAPSAVLVAATTSHYYVWDQSGQDWTDLSGSMTGDESTHNIMRVYQKSDNSGTVTTMYGCNGVDTNKKYVFGDVSVSNMGGAGGAGTDFVPIAKAMMVLADRMILGNLQTNDAYAGAIDPQCVSVSASQDPTTGYGTVLEDQLADTPGSIVCMMEMGNLQGAIYKDDAIYLATAATDIVPFTFSLKAVVPGPVSPRAVVRINDSLHIYLATNGDLMSFNGVTAQPLGRHLQLYVLQNWNRLMAIRSNGWYDHENNEVVMAFPDLSTGDCSRAILMRVTDDPPSLWPLRWATMRVSAGIRAIQPGGIRYFDMDGTPHVAPDDKISALVLPLYEYNALGTSLLVGDVTSSKIFNNTGTTDNDQSIPALLQTGLNAFGSPNKWKSILYFDFVFNAVSAGQIITVGVIGTSYGEASTTPLSSATDDISETGQHRTWHRCADRRLGYLLTCDATEAVELNAGYLAYVEQGLR